MALTAFLSSAESNGEANRTTSAFLVLQEQSTHHSRFYHRLQQVQQSEFRSSYRVSESGFLPKSSMRLPFSKDELHPLLPILIKEIEFTLLLRTSEGLDHTEHRVAIFHWQLLHLQE